MLIVDERSQMRSISSVLICLWLSISLESVAGKRKHVDQIVHGFPAKPGEFPFMAHIDIWKTVDGLTNYCCGTVIDNRHILTATHCVINGGQSELKRLSSVDDVTIRLGCYNRWNCKQDAYEHNNSYGVEKIMAHHAYGAELANDITLLRTDREIKFRKHGKTPVGVIKLVGGDDTCCDEKEETLKAIGWGQIEGNKIPTHLQQVDLKTLSYKQCKKNFPHINKVVLCAGDAKQGPCFGDSGGPLVRKLNETNNYEQVAVFSFVEVMECVHPKGAGYTKVAPFIPWIKNCTSGKQCKTI